MKHEGGSLIAELCIAVCLSLMLCILFVPRLAKAMNAADEVVACRTVRRINAKQTTYKATVGGGVNFAPSLAALKDVGLIGSHLASGKKCCYLFLTIGTAATAVLPSYYDTLAEPETPGDGSSFYSNETGNLYKDSAPIPIAPAPPGSRVPATGALLTGPCM